MKIIFSIGSYFLLLAFVGHSFGHFLFYIYESRFDAERTSLMNSMKAYIADRMFFDTSMWTLLKMFSMTFSLLFLFAGLMNLMILKSNLPDEFLQRTALFNSVFWFISLVLFSALNPAVQPIVICLITTVLFGTSYYFSRV